MSTTNPTAWRKSSHSGGNGDCVEVAVMDEAVAVRDSKNPDGPHLAFTRAAFTTFVRALTNGSLAA